jgi:hypothetical protein
MRKPSLNSAIFMMSWSKRPPNEPRAVAVVDALIRVQSARRFERSAADKQVVGAGHDFVVAAGPYNFERRIVAGHGRVPLDRKEQIENNRSSESRGDRCYVDSLTVRREAQLWLKKTVRFKKCLKSGLSQPTRTRAASQSIWPSTFSPRSARNPGPAPGRHGPRYLLHSP